MLEKVERLISEINRIHLEYSKDYFETGKIEKSILSIPLPKRLFSLIGLTYTRLSMTI